MRGSRIVVALIGLVILASAVPADAAVIVRRVEDINPGSGGSNPAPLIERGGVLFLSAEGAKGRELWKTDGTNDGTRLVADIKDGSEGSDPGGFGGQISAGLGRTVLFGADDGSRGFELWRTDGTPSGTRLVESIRPGPEGGVLEGFMGQGDMATVGGRVLFVGNDGDQGTELWASDGTPEGTDILRDIYPGADSSSPQAFFVLENEMYFSAFRPGIGRELWRTDGTRAGTTPVKDINEGTADSRPDAFFAFDGEAFFVANDGTSGRELWRSNGTEAGTTRVADINPGGGDSGPFWFTVLGRRLLFSADDGAHGRELWRSDGTEDGTRLVKDINPDATASSPFALTTLGDLVLFNARHTATDAELMRTDGTARGTKLVKNISTRPRSFFGSNPHGLARFGDEVFFSAKHNTAGVELFSSDGTTPGTGLVENINPTGDSNPLNLIRFDDVLLFSASDGQRGQELWKVVRS